jgi:hypothetical protein
VNGTLRRVVRTATRVVVGGLVLVGASTLLVTGGTAGTLDGSSGASAHLVVSRPASLTTFPSPSGSAPILGLLQATAANFAEERAAGVDSVTIGMGWADAQPAQGSFSSAYMEDIQNEIAAARTSGLSVVLDPGLQYPPSWAFSLPGGTQFVDQYGDVFSGSPASGDDVVNAVTDMSVRSAESSYLAWLGNQIDPGEIIAIRQGGGPLGELRYPSGDYDNHTNSFWAYDTSSQAALPASVRGWVPGTETTSQAQAFLSAYNQNLDNYGVWLNGQLEADFGTEELVMLPGWGERPGGAATEVSALLNPTPAMDEFNEGLDWTDLLDALPDADHSIAYTTYLDAESVQGTPQLEDPADYLSSVVANTPIRLGGENTGNGTIADLDLSMARAVRLDFAIVDWMGEPQLISAADGTDPGGPTLAGLVAAYESATGSVISGLTIADTSLPLATMGQPYSTALIASGGKLPTTWSVSSGALPSGLSLDPTTGVISGLAVSAGRSQFTVRVDDGTASATAAFAITTSAGAGSTALAEPIVGIAATPDGGGYWIANSAGAVETFGDAVFFGSMDDEALNAPIVHIVATSDGGGYWLVSSDGGIFAFGDAPFYGSMGDQHLNAPVVDLAPTPDGRGYWLAAADGGLFAFGDAPFYGSMGGRHLNAPVVGIAGDQATGGYWLVSSDGGIFSFDAPFFGSTGALRLNKPIEAMAVTADGGGYWFVGSDGGIFAYGDAQFYGSTGAIVLNRPIVSMTADFASGGYWMVGADGGVFSFRAAFLGGAAG